MHADPIDVLIVEDEVEDARRACDLLASAVTQIQTRTVATLEGAIKAIIERRPDVVLYDLVLPDVSGLQGLKKLRLIDPHMAIVVLTNFTEEGVGEDVILAGAQDFIPKQKVTQDALIRIVHYAHWRQKSDVDLRRRESQLSALAEIGHVVLLAKSLEEILECVVRALKSALQVEYCKILEIQHDEKSFRLVAGQGWEEKFGPGFVFEIDPKTQAGFTVKHGRPVTVADIHSENRFANDFMLRQHGIVSGASVVAKGVKEPFGVISVHSRVPRIFQSDEIQMLQLVANMLVAGISRKQAEAVLENENRKFHALFDHATDAILVADDQARFVSANPAACSLLGLSREDILGTTLGDYVTPEKFDVFKRTWNSFQESHTQTGEFQLFLPSGDFRIVEYSATAHFIPGQHLSILRDVTERKRWESKLRESEQKFREMAESLDEVLWMTDIQKSKVAYVNPAYERVWGRSCRSLYENPRSFIEAIHPEDRPKVACSALNRQVSTEYDETYRVVRPDGSIRWVHDRATPIRDSAGNVTRIVGVATDITERKLSDEAVRKSEAVFRHLFNSNIIGVVVDRMDGTVEEANDAYLNLLGYTREDVKAGRLNWMTLTPEESLPASRRSVDEVKATGACKPFEKKLLRKDGVAVPVLVGVVRISEMAGRCVTFVVDLRHQKVKEAQVLLSDKLVALGTLAAGVAHEINNPLTYIIMNIEQILSEVTDKTDQEFESKLPSIRELARNAADGVSRVQRIVYDLKSMSRKDDDVLQPVDVHKAIQAAINIASSEIRHKAKLQLNTSNVPQVLANEARLTQVVLNLLINAAQAIEEGNAEQNEIAVATGVDEEGLVFMEVRDTGQGMSPEVLKRIFDPFFTTKPVGVGTGVGLPLCHGIVTSLGGQIQVSSVEGHGSCFRILLPVCRDTQAEPPHAKFGVFKRLDMTTPTRASILVVDDEPMMLESIQRVLGKYYDVAIAESGKAASDLLMTRKGGQAFDVILCDLMMPDMTGMELFDALQKNLPEAAKRMVFMTGGAFTAAMEKFLTNVPNRKINKPFRVKELQELIRETLSGWQESGVTPRPRRL